MLSELILSSESAAALDDLTGSHKLDMISALLERPVSRLSGCT